jgi:type IV pilus assembly protein PilX
LPLSPPRYLIELLPSVRAGEDAGKARQAVFRITAFGYGARPGTLVVLQSVYRGAGSGAGQT